MFSVHGSFVFLLGWPEEFLQLVNMLFNKVLGENEKYVFLFLFKKPNELFGPPKAIISFEFIRAPSYARKAVSDLIFSS